MKKKFLTSIIIFIAIFPLIAQESFDEEDLSFIMQENSSEEEVTPIYSGEKIITIVQSDIKLVIDSDKGTFFLYSVPEKGREIPLLANSESDGGTFFALRSGRKVYKLEKTDGIYTEARRTETGAQLAYLVHGAAQVVIDFSFLPSIAGSSRIDMLRVTIFTINIGKSMQSFAIKGVFDTRLGENTKSHFSTATRSKINSELQLTSLSDDLWIRSSSSKSAIQFLLEGEGISTPDLVSIGGKNTIVNTVSWVPPVKNGKSFSSVFSYNNSALCINWKNAYLDPLRTDTVSFFISVSSDGNTPAGKKFLQDLAEGQTELGVYTGTKVSTTDVAPSPIQLTPEEAGVSSRLVDGASEPFIDVSESQLDPEYVQDLLDRIAILTESDDVDKGELYQLNLELDSILDKFGVYR